VSVQIRSSDDPVYAILMLFGVAYALMVGAASRDPLTGLGLVLLNLTVVAVALSVMPRMRASRGWIRFVGVTLPLFVFYLYFKEAGLALGGPDVVWLDSEIAGFELGWWESAGTDPRSPFLGELLALAYMSYVPLLLLVAVAMVRLPLRGAWAPAETYVRRICIAWAICYVLYLAVPVLGPRFVYTGYQGPRMGEGPASALARLNQSHGMLRGAAFPSAHLAATAVAVWSAWCWRRTLFLPVLSVSVALAIGAVYLGYHYVVDVAAGLLVAVLAIGVDSLPCRRSSSGNAIHPTLTLDHEAESRP